jgi:hypothetical protein
MSAKQEPLGFILVMTGCIVSIFMIHERLHAPRESLWKEMYHLNHHYKEPNLGFGDYKSMGSGVWV